MKLGAGRDESEFKLAPPPQRRPLSNPHAELAEGDGRRSGDEQREMQREMQRG